MSDEAVAVFTARSTHRILREGGSQAWTLDANRARKCQYLICVQNQHNPDRDFSDTTEEHGAVFMIAKISDVVPSQEPDCAGRWHIRISEYSVHTVMNAWQGWRNPVRYTTLKDMGIRLEDLEFHSVKEVQAELAESTGEPTSPAPENRRQDDDSVVPLSISNAKAGLAAYYGVGKEAIEIIIRG